MPGPAPAFSIIVPVRNAGATLDRCLSAIARTKLDADELIVVDDGSTEDVNAIAEKYGRVARLSPGRGPAAARNEGARLSSHPILCFLDADVVVHAGALDRARTRFASEPIDALVGSYDDSPDAPGLVSRFKNLAHHYFHQRAAGRVRSFWAGCGFVRRAAFDDAGGFDATRFTTPSIEDVDFGWRLSDRGRTIVLDPAIQVTHLKRWTLGTLVAVDTWRRAMPWTERSLERGGLHPELNATTDQRVAAVLALLLPLSIGAILIDQRAAWIAALILAGAVLINRSLFGLLWRRGGAALGIAGVFLQQIYYYCATAGLAAGAIRHWSSLHAHRR